MLECPCTCALIIKAGKLIAKKTRKKERKKERKEHARKATSWWCQWYSPCVFPTKAAGSQTHHDWGHI